MKRWSLKVKVGAYAALLTMLALGVTASVIMPLVYYQQVRELDSVLASDAEELYRDLKNFRGAPLDPRRPISARFVTVALQTRYVVVRGPEAQILYRSPNLGEAELPFIDHGVRTIELMGKHCRVGTYVKGPYTIQIGSRLRAITGFQLDLLRAFLMSLPLAGLVVFFGGIWLGRRAVAPVAGLTEAAERISAERPGERLPMPLAQDEIARLTEVLYDSFDRMQKSYDAARRFSADAFDLATLAAASMDDLEALTSGHGVTVEKALPDSLPAIGDQRWVALVLQNLVENAAKYTPANGRIRLRAGQDEKSAWVRVGNSGTAIPEPDQAKLFERFYRGSAVGEAVRGQGLGLNIARELARAQNGELTLLISANDWTEFELRLPV
ncbi:MAG: ATP-binding protein [Verrucomicrobia bacterium]|nr:ATP-binding protein [Verrucomicrobiota bacterium]MDA1006377.1 ATP-binding protein [Verrucomicrobiota bacterium]